MGLILRPFEKASVYRIGSCAGAVQIWMREIDGTIICTTFTVGVCDNVVVHMA